MNDKCAVAEQISKYADEAEQYSASDYLSALCMSDDAEVVIENEPVTLDAIAIKYLSRSELEELAVTAVRGDYSAVRKVFIDAISEIMK